MVQSLYPDGLSKAQILKRLGVCRSTYYGWLRRSSSSSRKASAWQLTPAEKEAVIQQKGKEPYWSHRQVSGSLRPQGYWVSPSSCYRLLTPLGWVSTPTLREAPWKVPRYEPFRPNQIWGEDWTILSIDYTRHVSGKGKEARNGQDGSYCKKRSFQKNYHFPSTFLAEKESRL